MSRFRHRRAPPAGSPIAREFVRGWRAGGPDPAARVSAELAGRLAAKRVDLVRSGREALRAALASLATRSGRAIVVLPAYTCFTVAASAVAAGLRIRLVDVDARGWIEQGALESIPLEEVAAVVACNLFGIAEPVATIATACDRAGAALVDDAAQALGARGKGGAAGGRGDVGIVSFGRGKPVSALGGGAIVWRSAPNQDPCELPSSQPARALLRALAHDFVLHPLVFPWVAALPSLHVGESRFEPDFPRGPIPGPALALAAALVPRTDALGLERARRAQALARRIGVETRFEPLMAAEGEIGVYPRLALRAPDRRAREAALEALRAIGVGVSAMYPTSLAEIPALVPHLTGPAPGPGASDLASRILTLPTGRSMSEGEIDRVIGVLARG